MEHALIVIVSVSVLALGVVAWVMLGARSGGEPLEVGKKTVDREDRPRAEKEQMDEPQPEFIEDARPPSAKK